MGHRMCAFFDTVLLLLIFMIYCVYVFWHIAYNSFSLAIATLNASLGLARFPWQTDYVCSENVWFVYCTMCDETIILTETETSYRKLNFPKPKPRLFFQDQIFDTETKFSKTYTETFFLRPFFSKPKPRLEKKCLFLRPILNTCIHWAGQVQVYLLMDFFVFQGRHSNSLSK